MQQCIFLDKLLSAAESVTVNIRKAQQVGVVSPIIFNGYIVHKSSCKISFHCFLQIIFVDCNHFCWSPEADNLEKRFEFYRIMQIVRSQVHNYKHICVFLLSPTHTMYIYMDIRLYKQLLQSPGIS